MFKQELRMCDVYIAVTLALILGGIYLWFLVMDTLLNSLTSELHSFEITRKWKSLYAHCILPAFT